MAPPQHAGLRVDRLDDLRLAQRAVDGGDEHDAVPDYWARLAVAPDRVPPRDVLLVRPDQREIAGLAVTEFRPPKAGPAPGAGQRRPVACRARRPQRRLDHVARPERGRLDPVDARVGPAVRGSPRDVQHARSADQRVGRAFRLDVVGERLPGAPAGVETEQLVHVARIQARAGRGHAQADAPAAAAHRRNGRRRQRPGSPGPADALRAPAPGASCRRPPRWHRRGRPRRGNADARMPSRPRSRPRGPRRDGRRERRRASPRLARRAGEVVPRDPRPRPRAPIRQSPRAGAPRSPPRGPSCPTASASGRSTARPSSPTAAGRGGLDARP